MSRSWERQVQKNTKEINKRRKKDGKKSIGTSNAPKVDRFKGRSYVVPILILMLLVFYITIAQPWSDKVTTDPTMTYVTIGCYVLIAVFYFLRRPYLAVTRDTLETRKFTGYKQLKPTDVRKITVSPGYVVIDTIKGANWVFSRTMNLYPINAMSERLKAYADLHHVEWEEKTK